MNEKKIKKSLLIRLVSPRRASFRSHFTHSPVPFSAKKKAGSGILRAARPFEQELSSLLLLMIECLDHVEHDIDGFIEVGIGAIVLLILF